MVVIDIDASDLIANLEYARNCLTPQRFESKLRTMMRRIGSHIRGHVIDDVPKHYEVSGGDVSKETGAARVSGLTCTVPIAGPRRTIGVQFKAKGSAPGWASRYMSYNVEAKILRGTWTVIEGNPFRNIPSSLGEQAYERAGARLPIIKLYGPAIPEMVTHRAAPDITKHSAQTLEQGFLAEFSDIF